MVIQNNCKNCGAPLSKHSCNYCGSDFVIVETPTLNNLKNGGKVEPKNDSWSNLSTSQKTAIILMSTFAPLAILKFYKK